MKPKPVIAITIVLVLSLFFAACSAGYKSAGGPTLMPETVGMSAVESRGYDMVGDSNLASAEIAPAPAQGQPAERLVIRNASLSLVVKSPAEFARQAGEMAAELGGFVVNATVYESENENGVKYLNASVALRVPADKLEQALSQLRSQAIQIKSEAVSGQDVTQEYVDLQARLKNLEAAERQLASIMEDARRTEDVMAVFQQLTYYRGEIEAVKGQIQYYEQSARMSMISIDATDEPAEREISIGQWKPRGVAKDAIRSLLRTFQALGSAAIWLALYFLPVGLVLLVIGVPVFKLARRFLFKRPAASP